MATRYVLGYYERHWRFQYLGTRHTKSIRQLKKLGFVPLDCPETKEASYRYALEWQRSIMGTVRLAGLPESHIEALEAIPKDAAPAIRHTLEEDRAEPMHASIVREVMAYVPRVAAPPKGKAVGEAIDQWLELSVKPRANSGAISQREVINHQYGLKLFREWQDNEDKALAELTSDRWATFYAYLCKLVNDGDYSSTYTKKSLRYTRDFLDWCKSMGYFPGLDNLRDRKMSIGESEPEKRTFTDKEVKAILEGAKGQQILHVLLALNCGFTQKDISDLTPAEVRGNAIIRKRSKNEKKEDNARSHLSPMATDSKAPGGIPF